MISSSKPKIVFSFHDFNIKLNCGIESRFLHNDMHDLPISGNK